YYDALYTSRTDVWREQGHTDEFTRYIVDLVDAAGPGRYLDVGCGEGLFLAEVQRVEGFGVDLSRQALLRARARSRATVALAVAPAKSPTRPSRAPAADTPPTAGT